ncbi:MAG: ATP-dependent chaperone ClpB, partial [Propionibacteriaceae bacterium]|nr:ATP-dependent chaperone ClpB [Propionibacteriaceae bacterium]
MDTEKLTAMSRDAYTAGVRLALTNGNPAVEPAHLLSALLLIPDNTVAPLLASQGADPAEIATAATQLIAKLPSTSGSSVAQPSLSGAVARVLAAAETQ